MKTTKFLVLVTFLVAAAACSKQENTEEANQVPKVEMPVMETPMDAKPAVKLPNEIDANDLSGSNVEQDASGKKVLYWEDPMVPGRHFSKSGQSPFMDMKLSPKYAE